MAYRIPASHRPADAYRPMSAADRDEMDVKLMAALDKREAMSPEKRDAAFLDTVTRQVADGAVVPPQLLEQAKALGWTPPDRLTLTALAANRIGGNGWTPDKQREFLLHLAENGVVAHACRHVGLSKQGANALRQRHPTSVFAILWDVAVRMGRRSLLDEATERALTGREEAVWHRGEQVGTRRVHNDRLLMFVLAHEPPPAHPNLTQRELEELWSSLLPEVDAVLPPSLAPNRIADLTAQPSGE